MKQLLGVLGGMLLLGMGFGYSWDPLFTIRLGAHALAIAWTGMLWKFERDSDTYWCWSSHGSNPSQRALLKLP